MVGFPKTSRFRQGTDSHHNNTEEKGVYSLVPVGVHLLIIVDKLQV